MNNLTIPNLLVPQSPTSQSITDSSSMISNTSPSSPSSVGGGGEDTTKAVKRKRLTQACDACRKKKVKCSGEKPSCQNCQRLKVACTYIPSTKKRGPRVGLVESLEKRLQQMEKLLQPLKEQGLVDDIEDRDIPSTSTKRPRLASASSKHNADSLNGSQSQQFDNLNADNAKQFQAPNAEFANVNVDIKSFGAISNSGPEDQPKNFMELPPLLTPQSGSPIRQTTPTTPVSSQCHIAENKTPQTTPPQQPQQLSPQTTGQATSNEKDHESELDVLLYFGRTAARPGFRTCREIFGGMNYTNSNTPALHDASSALSNNASASFTFGYSREVSSVFFSPSIPRMKNKENLPPKDVIMHLADCHFHYSHTHMPMFHKATFLRRLEENKVSPFLIFALCAASARFSDRPGIIRTPRSEAGEEYAEFASEMILDSFDEPTVEHCQALLLMAWHHYGCKRGPRSWMYVGLAIRMAQELGLHKEFEGPALGSSQKIDSEAAFIDREVRRRTFWSCFVVDRFAACALGRPALIDEADIEIRLPIPDRDWDEEHPRVVDTEFGALKKVEIKKAGRMILENKGLFALLVSVAALLGRAAQNVNRSKPNESLPPWDPHSDYHILLNQMENWYNDLCPNMVWSIDKLREHREYNLGSGYVSIHLLYYATIVILNRPHASTPQNDVPVDFMEIAADRCKKASRAVSEITHQLLLADCFYGCPFLIYPVFAASIIHIDEVCKNYGEDSDAKKYLCLNLQFLKAMQDWWAMATKVHFMLKEMYKDQSEKEYPSRYHSDLGLRDYWNRPDSPSRQSPKILDRRELAITTTANVTQPFSMPDSNFGIQSILLPNDFMSSRIFPNETTSIPESWFSMLKTPSPRLLFRPNTNKKDFTENGEYIGGNDYFSLYNAEMPTGFSYDALLNDALNNDQLSMIPFDLLSPGRASRTNTVKYIMNETTINASDEQISTTSNTNSQVAQQQFNEQNTFSLMSTIAPPSSQTVL
ncbi:9397_t:CDS:2 [Ambispora leptoticha]|uniref:9397_t:CDS:1 n=1 Tax=Ambispora leptoticha TaxID=144679 RepID=A0A9N8WHZ2_9GLOM|nr:9397_t:CDS:2 [Ambispora leptoticha]